jgi:hypothetical protein
MRRRAPLFLLPTATEHASPQVRLGLQIRADASLRGCCACGAEPTYFEILSWDPQDPQVRQLDGPPENGLAHAVYAHKHDCPAASDEVEAALAGPSTTKEA